jgi:hypothetical protein
VRTVDSVDVICHQNIGCLGLAVANPRIVAFGEIDVVQLMAEYRWPLEVSEMMRELKESVLLLIRVGSSRVVKIKWAK